MDGIDARVFVELRDRVLIHPAVASKELHATVYTVYLAFGYPKLRHGGGSSIQLALEQ